MSASMRLASIWAVWAFVAIGSLGWSLFVLLEAFGVLDDAAAWVQAIGSILAVIVAIVVASQQHRRDEARRNYAEASREFGLALRLYGFGREFYLNVLELLQDEELGSFISNPSVLAAATAYTDKKIATVLERMLVRLNSNFDDDMDHMRRRWIDAYRQNLAGLIFLLNETTDSELSTETRRERLAEYRKAAEQLLDMCRDQVARCSQRKDTAERAL